MVSEEKLTMLDFRIETFLAVCKHMNYTKAAEELNITQPGVSQHIRFIENYYGDKLFRYVNKSLELTQAGIELKNAMIAVKHDNMHLQRAIKNRGFEKQIIRFGATLTIGEFLLPDLLVNYIKANEKVQIDFIVEDTKVLLKMLEDGKIDFAVVEGYFQKSEYESITISKEPFVLACGMDYPLKEVKNFKQLFMHNLIIREDGSGTKEVMGHYLEEKGLSFSDFVSSTTSNSIQVIKKLLEGNCGISFLYEIAVKKEIEAGLLRKIVLPDFPLFHEFNYIWRKNSIFQDYYKSLFENIVNGR